MLPNPTPFLDQIFKQLADAGINNSLLYLDHICYRVATKERYHELKTLLHPHQILAETQISGRPITTFQLQTPYAYKNRCIPCLELPHPKLDSPYPEDFEHIEFVIRESFSDFMNRHPKVTFDLKGSTKTINPDIRLSLPAGSVKFHHYPLAHVIRYLDE